MTKLLTKLACCSSDDLFVMWSAGGGRGVVVETRGNVLE